MVAVQTLYITRQDYTRWLYIQQEKTNLLIVIAQRKDLGFKIELSRHCEILAYLSRIFSPFRIDESEAEKPVSWLVYKLKNIGNVYTVFFHVAIRYSVHAGGYSMKAC